MTTNCKICGIPQTRISDNNYYCEECSKKLDEKYKEQSKFITKDSGVREEFPTGAKRDTQDGKPRFDLIPITALKRLADLYARGAQKYSENNWRAGISISRCYSSAFRHLMQFASGDKDEDHLAAVAFNVFCIIHFEETKRADLDDMQKYRE